MNASAPTFNGLLDIASALRLASGALWHSCAWPSAMPSLVRANGNATQYARGITNSVGWVLSSCSARRERFLLNKESTGLSLRRKNIREIETGWLGDRIRTASFQFENLILDERQGFELAISPTGIFAGHLTSILSTGSTEVRRKKPIRERFWSTRQSTSTEV